MYDQESTIPLVWWTLWFIYIGEPHLKQHGKGGASKQASKKRKKNKNKSEQDKINRKKSQRKSTKEPT